VVAVVVKWTISRMLTMKEIEDRLFVGSTANEIGSEVCEKSFGMLSVLIVGWWLSVGLTVARSWDWCPLG